MIEKQDRRTQRTRHLLSEALVELIREKGHNSITVSDIITRANVGRSTFYAHYRDKDDLLIGELDRVIDVLDRHIPHESREKFRFFPVLDCYGMWEKSTNYIKLLFGARASICYSSMCKNL